MICENCETRTCNFRHYLLQLLDFASKFTKLQLFRAFNNPSNLKYYWKQKQSQHPRHNFPRTNQHCITTRCLSEYASFISVSSGFSPFRGFDSQPEENAGITIRDSTSPKLHSTVEKWCFNNGPFSATTIMCQQFQSPVPTFRSPCSLSKGRAAERISRTQRNGERIFCFEYKTKEKKLLSI